METIQLRMKGLNERTKGNKVLFIMTGIILTIETRIFYLLRHAKSCYLRAVCDLYEFV